MAGFFLSTQAIYYHTLTDFLIPLYVIIVLVVLDKYLFASINLKKDDMYETKNLKCHIHVIAFL